jgi:hypothetical protein
LIVPLGDALLITPDLAFQRLERIGDLLHVLDRLLSALCRALGRMETKEGQESDKGWK